MMRLFAALQPPPSFREALEEVQERLRDAGVTGRWLDPSGFHMTLAFVGMWPEDFSRFLPPVRKPFSVTLSHIGIFPGADVLWAGIEPSEDLCRLAEDVRRSMANASVPFDGKPFYPHFTLARRPRLPEDPILPEIEVPRRMMTVSEVCVFRSERGEHGMEYTVIGRSAQRAEAERRHEE